MLLPSDVARLVLGYLQEEGLSATSQAFIHESPNLKEYADHTIGDGTIPACVFSVFGKGLTTILNEYVAAKTKESCPEVPAVMTSLWKKLDFTLNQIKSLQNAPAACQRTRSRIGVANLTRQRVMTVASAGAVVCSSVSETSSIISPASTSHSMLGHSTPVSYAAPHIRPAAGSSTHQQIQDVRLNTPRDSPVQVIVSEHRLNPGPMSPGRRKWDTPRKRGGAVSGSSGPGRCATAASNPSAEPQPEEAVEENFPQLVIQSARDKILGDRSLQEKLAENINKILASDPMPQTSKASSTVEADQSIDEILGLQGEIHMSDDAIHDILEQTESDPAFQALYDLFDYNKTRFTDGEPGDGDIGSTPEESATAGPASAVRPPQSDDPGTTHRDANASDTTPMQVKTKAGQEKERKTRKSTVPSLKKTVLCSSGRASRIENSSARLLVSQGEQRGASSTAVDLNRKQKASLFSNSVFDTPMDIDEPLNTPPPLVDTMEPASKDGTSTMTALSESTTAPSLRSSAAFSVPGLTSVSTVDNKQEHKQAEAFKEQPATAPFGLMIQPALLPSIQVEQNNAPITTVDLPQISCSGGSTQPVFTLSVTPESASSTSASTVTAFTAAPGSASTSATLTATPASSVSTSHTSSTSCTPVGVTLDPPTSNPTTQSKSASDSNIVSLKIIISDNQDEGASSDPALTQAVSSISGDKIPTIYLSSPAKSPAPPGTPKAGLDEAAQAVSGLQSSEVHASPLSSRAGALMASPLTGTSQVQQNYIIQLPLDTSTPALQGATASYFLVTEPPTTDAQTRPVLLSTGVSKGQPLPVNQFGMATPTSSQGYSTGSALILPSPVKPMMLPVSVMGQNTLGKVQMVSNQLVAIPNAVPVQQAETVKPSSPSVSIKWTKLAGTEQVSKVVLPVSADKAGKQDTAKGPKHKRILCFDSSAEVQTQPAKATRAALPPATNTSTSRSVQQIEKDKTKSFTLTRPNVLSGNKPKRRVETVKCSTEPQTDGGFAKEVETLTLPPQRQTDTVKKHSRKQDHSIRNQDPQSASTSRVDASQPETLKKSESGNRSKSIDRKHSHDKDGDGAKVKDSRSLSSDSAQKSGSRKEKEENSRKEPAEKAPAKSREGRSEKRTSSQETPNVTANKENEIKGSMQEQQQSTPSSSASRDFSPPAVTQSPSNPQSKVAKAPSKTSSLAKQAAEMLNDIQGLGSPSASGKRPAASTTDPSLPRTPGSVRDQEEPADCPRTPSRQKKGKEGEGTPKHLKPPNTPDVPTCSPASEAGSENSINMAAHTLMILSRAAIARTGTPLKDSLRQEGVGEKSSASSKNSKKRKLSSPKTSPPAKKDRERKKLIDCFPHDLDVDKFLSSLHYDE